MTERQRAALLVLPTTEDEVIRYHSLSLDDLDAIAGARTPETRLGYALIQSELRSGALVAALDAFAVDAFANLYAITTTSMPSRRVTKLIDFLAEELRTMKSPGY